jgi:hypothetical protein
MSNTKKKNLVIQEEIDGCLRRISNSNSNKSNQEQLLKLLQEMQITLDDVIFEDSIEGTRLRATYHTEISRKVGRRGVEDITRFQYIKEIHIDYGNVPIRYRDNAITTTSASSSNDTSSYYTHGSIEDPIIESYDILEKNSPTLYEILGLLKRIYFMPEDFSNRLVVDRVHKLRNMFSKEEVLTFPSIGFDDKTGLVPI